MEHFAFEKLVGSYAALSELSCNEVEKALRIHAKKFRGCISCQYSIAIKHNCHGEELTEPNWLTRKC
jgi:hypothetical protein